MKNHESVCDKKITIKSKNKHFISPARKAFRKSKHIRFTNKDPDINKIDNGFCSYICEHNKKFNYYLVKVVFQLVFN